MYWASPLVAKAVTVGLVSPRAVRRLERRVRRRTRDFPSCDFVWADELARARLISRYQSQALLRDPSVTEASAESTTDAETWPLELGPYVVLERVGRSDLGATYRCRAASGGDTWAVKRLSSKWAAAEECVARVGLAVEAWNDLADPRVAAMKIVPLADAGVGVATKWQRGTSLADLVRAGRRRSPVGAIAIIRDLIAVLATADGRALVHGDLKPSNIFVVGRGQLILADCGLRRAVPTAGLLVARCLPPERYDYVAPEVAAGELPPDAAGDIYSLGCLFYHLVAGRPPFMGGDAERKLAAHRAGRVADLRSSGIELTAEARLLLDATLQADRGRRAHSYNDLISRLPPHNARLRRRVHAELRRGHVRTALPGEPHDEAGSAGSEVARNRWARRLVGAAVIAATAVAIFHGSRRIMPLLSLRAPTKTASPAQTKYSDGLPHGRATENRAVTALWNATEDLRAAYREAAPHDTITLRSPGPFLIDAIDIAKPITLRGADDVRPLFVGGPGASLRVTASDVRLENVHFVRVAAPLPGQQRRDSRAMLEVAGDRATICRSSFDDTGGADESSIAIEWRPAESEAGSPSEMSLESVLIRHVAAGVSVTASTGTRLSLANCLHLGPGPLIDSASPRGRPFQSCDVSLSHVSVIGAGTVAHHFPHPLDDALSLTVTARQCVLVPRDREQPIVEISYAAQPGTLMPKVSWSGTGSVCPANATTIAVRRGPTAAPWRATDIAAWQAYWGSHATGLTGAPIGFAPVSDASPPRPSVPPATDAGVNPELLWFPPEVAIEQLPVMLERLNP